MEERPVMPEDLILTDRQLEKIENFRKRFDLDTWEDIWDDDSQKNITYQEFIDLLEPQSTGTHIRNIDIRSFTRMRNFILSLKNKIGDNFDFVLDRIQELVDKLEIWQDYGRRADIYSKEVEGLNSILTRELDTVRKERDEARELLQFLVNHAEQIPEFKNKIKIEPVKAEIVEEPQEKKKTKRIDF